MPFSIDMPVDVHRETGDRNVACEGCGKVTAALVVLKVGGYVADKIPICVPCQELMELTGWVLDTEERRHIDRLVGEGVSSVLAARIARRWFAR